MSLIELQTRIHEECMAIAALLEADPRKLVLAESCTAGLAAASLAAVPGMSRFLCGSAVVYREPTKIAWLGVTEEDLAEHTAVSDLVAREMAIGVLANTPEADLALSVTGHLGPGAPAEQDGVIFLGHARRDRTGAGDSAATARQVRLVETGRVERQHEATLLVLLAFRAHLFVK